MLSVGLGELIVVQPVAQLGPALLRVPREAFAPFVDVLRALVWCAGVGIGAAGFMVRGRPPEASEERDDRRQRWLWSVLDAFSEGIVAFDVRGRVVFANRASLELLQRRALPDGTPMAAFADVPRLRSSVAKALLDREPVTVELFTRSPARTLMALACPVDEGAVLLMVDVTEIRAAVRAREAFLTDAAHELRTPVAGVMMGAEALLLGGLEREDRARSLTEGIARQGARLQRLVDDLMALVRLESGAAELDLEDADLGDLVADGLDGIPDQGDRVTVLGGPPTTVRADSMGFERVLRNLVENALRYTDGPVTVGWGRSPEGVWLAVADEGPGIPDAHKDRVFDRFHRVDTGRSRQLGGTGLGLAIVRELVERFGGTVDVEDVAPTGARFVVRLPEPGEAPPVEGGPSTLLGAATGARAG